MIESLAIITCIALTVGTFPYWFFKFLQKKTKQLNSILLVFSSLIAFWLSVAAYLSTQFPGMINGRVMVNEYVGIVKFTRDFIIVPGALLSLLLPVWWILFVSGITSVYSIVIPKLPLIAAIIAVIFTLIGICLFAFTGCTHAGACF